MVNLSLLKDTKQLPWRDFPIHKVLQDISAQNFRAIDQEAKKLFTIHPEDKDKVEVQYHVTNPFKKPEESFIELNTLRSKKDFSSFYNTFCTDQLCALLSVKENKNLKHPVYINLPSTQKYQNFQYGINMKKNSSANVYEVYTKNTQEIFVHNVNSFISLQENACLKFISENSKASSTVSTRHMHNYLYKNSHFYLNYYSVENTEPRPSVSLSFLYNVHTFLMGEAANFLEQALILAKNKTNYQHYSNIYHLQPYGQSSQLHKALLDDSAKSVFNALVFIGSNCPQVNSHQLNNNLSFSKKTKIVSQPQLQVKTDDVKATHGSTTGQVQAEELYYLQSRGISFNRSKQLLKQAFVNETQNNITNSIIKKNINIILQGYDD